MRVFELHHWLVHLLGVFIFATVAENPNSDSPEFLTPVSRNSKSPLTLLKRQSCKSGYNSCASLGAPDACCPDSTNCAHDQSGNVACCPQNYVCTGVIGGAPSSSVTSSGAGSTASGTNAGSGSVSVVTITSTAGVSSNPSGTTNVSPASSANVTPVSTLSNIYYPFGVIPTSFANAAVCSSYYAYCQAESSSCFNSLAGQNGVTVSNAFGGGGTTVQGTTATILTGASSICSSLSATACYHLQASQCASFGSEGASGTGFVGSGAAPQQTRCPQLKYAAGLGAIVAVGMGL